MSLTESLASFAIEAGLADLSSATVDATKRVTLDTLGCAVGGRGVVSSRAVTEVKVGAGGKPESTVLVGGERLPMASTACVNAHYANALDAEETILHSGHLAACVVPPALAVAERAGSSGAELLAAIAVGFDVAARIGLSLRNFEILEDGSLEIAPAAGLSWASFASTVVAARLLGLDPAQTASAFGITVASAPLPISGKWGNMPSPRPMTKYGMYGAMAEAGVSAVLLARAGFTGDPTILDGDRGFWRMMGSRQCDWEWLSDGLGERWLVEETSYKLYPACRFSTPALDLFYRLRAEAGAEADDIESVRILVPHVMIAKHMHDPTAATVVDGQFSLPHTIGLAARLGPPGPDWHSPDALHNPQVAAFAGRVTVSDYPEANAILGRLLREQGHAELIPTSMTMTVGGREFTARTDHASGDPWADGSAVDDAGLGEKFRLFCSPHLRSEAIETAAGLIASLEVQPEVGPLVAALVA